MDGLLVVRVDESRYKAHMDYSNSCTTCFSIYENTLEFPFPHWCRLWLKAIDVLLARNETIFMDLMEGLYEEPDDIYGLLQWATNGKKKHLEHSIWMGNRRYKLIGTVDSCSGSAVYCFTIGSHLLVKRVFSTYVEEYKRFLN